MEWRPRARMAGGWLVSRLLRVTLKLAGFDAGERYDRPAVSKMNVPLVQEIAYYLLSHAAHDGVSVGTTKLVKLFYLIDHEYYRWHRRTLTDAPWQFYHYGPYCEELVQAAQKASGIEPEQAFEFSEGKFYRGYKVTTCHTDASSRWPAPVRAAVTSVYERWGPATLPLLLDYVYFETQPMLHATRFKPLDFSVIPDPRQVVEAPRDFSKLISKEKREGLRRRLLAREGGYRVTRPMQVNLDAASESALLAMGEDE